MKVLAVLLALAGTCLYVQAQNVVCGKGKSSKTVTLEDGESYSFKTHKGKKYKGNTECTVDYKMGDTCAEMSFACTKFNTNNKDKKKCKKGDMVTITANGKAKAYCKTKKPKVTSSGDMQVVFSSDAKKHSSGAVCKVTCTESASTTATTTEAAGGGGAGANTDCPVERPPFNSACSPSEEGLTCPYGNQTCCGETSPEIVMECRQKMWVGYFVDTICVLGGSCPTKTTLPSPSCTCAEIYSPVCGEDGRTYSNTCYAGCGSVQAACEGECPCTDCICPAVFSPVCGEDGKTYSNDCKAGCDQAGVACQGECPCT